MRRLYRVAFDDTLSLRDRHRPRLSNDKDGLMNSNMARLAALALIGILGLSSCEDVTAADVGECLSEPCSGEACNGLIEPG